MSGLLSAHGYDDGQTSATFTVSADDIQFSIFRATANGAALENNGTMSADANEITIEFSLPVDEVSLDEITFEKKVDESNTTAIKGLLTKEIDGNNVKFKFGRLEDGEKYILTVPETVKSGEKVLGTELKYEVTANLDWFIKTGFDELDGVEGIDGTTLTEHLWLNSTIKNGANLRVQNSTKINVEKEGDDYVLQMAPSAIGDFGLNMYAEAGGTGTKTFDQIFIGEKPGYVFVTDAKVRMSKIDPNGSFDANTSILHPVANEVYTWGVKNDGAVSTYTVSGTNAASAPIKYTAGEPFEYSNVRVVMRSANDATNANKSTYTMYDMDGGSIQKAIVHTRDYSTTTPANRIRHKIAAGYAEGEAHLNGRIDLTEFSALSVKAMDVMATTYNNVSDTVTIAMSDDVDVASLSTIKVNEGAVPVNPSYDADSRTITLAFDYGVPAGTHSVDLSGVLSAHGYDDGQTSASFTVEDVDAGAYMAKPVFKSGEKIIVNTVTEGKEETQIAIADATEVTVTTTITDAPETTVGFLAVYQGDLLIKVVEATIVEGALTATATGLPTGAKNVKLFVWSDLETMQPIFKPSSYL